MADFAKKNPAYSLADAARLPLIPSLKLGWLEDLRHAAWRKTRQAKLNET
jgi:hypothetical protein